MQELSIYDVKREKKEIVAKLYSPLKYKDEYRCDLHPRWNWRGDKICFDATYNNIRSLCTINYE